LMIRPAWTRDGGPDKTVVCRSRQEERTLRQRFVPDPPICPAEPSGAGRSARPTRSTRRQRRTAGRKTRRSDSVCSRVPTMGDVQLLVRGERVPMQVFVVRVDAKGADQQGSGCVGVGGARLAPQAWKTSEIKRTVLGYDSSWSAALKTRVGSLSALKRHQVRRSPPPLRDGSRCSLSCPNR
jgi:hypothetical protein